MDASASEPPDLFFAAPNDEFLAAGHYTPLDQSRLEIRLIKILSCIENDPIRCQLTPPIPLRSTPTRHKYAALSYAAGDVHDLATIEVNGTPFTAFSSLVRALKALSYHMDDSVEGVWIDQISINQHDLYEKAWQVSSMKDIYSLAAMTFVFLCMPENEQVEYDVDQLAWDICDTWIKYKARSESDTTSSFRFPRRK